MKLSGIASSLEFGYEFTGMKLGQLGVGVQLMGLVFARLHFTDTFFAIEIQSIYRGFVLVILAEWFFLSTARTFLDFNLFLHCYICSYK